MHVIPSNEILQATQARFKESVNALLDNDDRNSYLKQQGFVFELYVFCAFMNRFSLPEPNRFIHVQVCPFEGYDSQIPASGCC